MDDQNQYQNFPMEPSAEPASQEADADAELDTILREYAEAPQYPEAPEYAEMPQYAETQEYAELPQENPADQVKTEAVLPNIQDLPMDAMTEDEALRQEISDQVSSVMEEGLPKSAAQESAEPGFAEPELPSEPARPRPTAVTHFSDDLRSFRSLTPGDAASKAKSAVSYYKWRCWVLALLTLAASYITVAPTYGWALPEFISYIQLPFLYLFILSALQIVGMLVSVSLVTDGIRAILRKKPKAETLVALSCFVNLLYTMQILVAPTTGGYLPYQMVCLLTLFFATLTRCLRYNALMHEARSLSVRSGKYAEIRGLTEDDGSMRMLFKQDPAPLERGFLNRLLVQDRSERFFRTYVPLAVVIAFVLAIAAAVLFTPHVPFLWCWSALLAVTVPLGALIGYVHPLNRVSDRLCASATALAGPEGIERLHLAQSAVLQERDLFPTKMMAVSAVRVFSGFTPEKVNLCAYSVLKASGSGLYHAMSASLPRTPVNMPQMEKFEYFESGGMGAYVNGDRVLLGTANFILRSGVRLPEGASPRPGIYVSINMQFAGMYPVKYDVQPSVRRALNYLLRRRVTPVLAVRDFNITAEMVESKFKLGSDSVGYPSLEARLQYSALKNDNDEEPLAVTAVDTSANYADAISAGKRVYAACRTGIVTGLISAILGIALVFFLLATRSPSLVTPFYLFYYLLLWYLPSFLMALGVNRR